MDWFPFTYEYEQSNSYNLFRMLSSKSHFLKVKDLFDVTSAEELKKKIYKVDGNFETNYGLIGAFPNHMKPISEYINPENIATKR